MERLTATAAHDALARLGMAQCQACGYAVARRTMRACVLCSALLCSICRDGYISVDGRREIVLCGRCAAAMAARR